MSNKAFLKAILEERPDLKEKVNSGEVQPNFPGLGYSAYTVILGDEVFKTSQSETWPGVEVKDLILGIERERNLLGYLNGTGLPVPELTYVGKNFSFFGMKRLPGQVLMRHDIQQMAPDDKLRLAKEVAAFCADLSNAVPMDDAKEMGLDVSPAERMFNPEQIYAEFLNPDVKKAFGDRYDFFKQAIESYIDYHHEKYADGQQFLMHCDLKEGNLLWNPEMKELTGVIDFGLSHLTGLESGFKKICEKYPADFVDMVLEEYSSLQSTQVTRKEIQLWACVEYVDYVLDELKSKKGHGYTREYADYVRAPLQLSSTPETPASFLPSQNSPSKTAPAF